MINADLSGPPRDIFSRIFPRTVPFVRAEAIDRTGVDDIAAGMLDVLVFKEVDLQHDVDQWVIQHGLKPLTKRMMRQAYR